jgi:hypothetical protein
VLDVGLEQLQRVPERPAHGVVVVESELLLLLLPRRAAATIQNPQPTSPLSSPQHHQPTPKPAQALGAPDPRGLLSAPARAAAEADDERRWRVRRRGLAGFNF